MSFDLQLAHACPHLTLEEPISLGADGRSLRTSQPCVLGGSIRIWVNGERAIPQAGFHSYAVLHGNKSGPFNIVSTAATLTITTSVAVVVVTLPSGTRVATSRILAAISAQTVRTVLTAHEEGGCLVLSDKARVGTASSVSVSGDAALLEILGFGLQKAARGKKVFPGWRLAEETVQGFSVARFPQFDSQVKSGVRFTVSYAVPRELCKRCQGTFVENDYRFEMSGHAATVVDENLLQQMALKAVLTALGSNPYHTWYGSSITTRIGSKAVGQTAAWLREDVQNSLQTTQRLQQAQAKYQKVSAKEQLYAVKSVAVYPHKDDPSTFLVDASVQNGSSDPVSISVVFTTPGSYATVRAVSRFLPGNS